MPDDTSFDLKLMQANNHNFEKKLIQIQEMNHNSADDDLDES
jgi:hypothetical protein